MGSELNDFAELHSLKQRRLILPKKDYNKKKDRTMTQPFLSFISPLGITAFICEVSCIPSRRFISSCLVFPSLFLSLSWSSFSLCHLSNAIKRLCVSHFFFFFQCPTNRNTKKNGGNTRGYYPGGKIKKIGFFWPSFKKSTRVIPAKKEIQFLEKHWEKIKAPKFWRLNFITRFAYRYYPGRTVFEKSGDLQKAPFLFDIFLKIPPGFF